MRVLLGGIENADDFYQVSAESSAEVKAKGPLGSNNMKGARAVNNFWTIKQSRNPQIKEKSYFGFEDKIHVAYEAKLAEAGYSMTNTPHLFTMYGLFEAVIEDINYDFSLVSSAIILVCVYTFFMLGSFSTIHCRVWVAFTGICCILLAYGAGFGFMYLIGMKSTGVH